MTNAEKFLDELKYDCEKLASIICRSTECLECPFGKAGYGEEYSTVFPCREAFREWLGRDIEEDAEESLSK